MSIMPNLIGMHYRDAIISLIQADIIPNDGEVRSVNGQPATVGYFSPWPVGIEWEPGTPINTVTAQSPVFGQLVTVTNTWGVGESYTPPIVLTVNAPSMSVSGQFTAGAFS